MTQFNITERNILGLTVVSISVLVYVFYSQLFEGLEPCKLCIWQRVPHAIVVMIGLLILFSKKYQIFGCYVATILMLIGFLTGSYHFGIELKLWSGPENCSSLQNIDTLSPEEFLQKILETPITTCDQIVWSLIGISMAGWNGIISFLLMILWGYNTLRLKRINKT